MSDQSKQKGEDSGRGAQDVQPSEEGPFPVTDLTESGVYERMEAIWKAMRERAI